MELLHGPRADKLSEKTRALHALNLHSVAGQNFIRQFQYDRAAVELESSLKFSERVGCDSDHSRILNTLGVAYHQGNRLSKALSAYRHGRKIAGKLGDETILFSIHCNVAAIRARMGKFESARETLLAAEALPAAKNSDRARAFLLYTRGLVERVALRDATVTWNEMIRLAEGLPDPLMVGYGRVYLLENEVLLGRWDNARKILKEAERAENR